MTCSACGAPFPEGARFCVQCGRELHTALDFLAGQSLRELVETEAPVPVPRALAIAHALCEALAEAHARGVAQPYLPPENIHIDVRDGRVIAKIIDVGIALMRGSDPQDTAAPRPHSVGENKLGWRDGPALDYASPERLMGKPLDGRDQVYTIGIVVYELLTGHTPFAYAKNPAALITAKLTAPPAPPSARHREVPRSLDAVVLACLAKDRDGRYADVTALAAALAAVA